MRIAAIIWCAAIAGLQVYLFRRIRGDLIKSHMDGPKGFRSLLAGWQNAGFVKIVEDEIRFWNGSKIYLCHCKDAKDVYKYQGAEIHVLLIDELTHFVEQMYRFLRSRVRMVGVKVPEWAKGRFPRILCGANPGNIGHLFVKRMFVDGAVPMELRPMPPEEGGKLRQYIPALLEDNPSMADDDPTYEHTLSGMGSPELVKAMRWGDWNVVLGAFFSHFDVRRHVVEPFAIPDHWLRFASKDWGSASPGSVGWWAVASDQVTIDGTLGQKIVIPRGALVRYREWYVARPDGVGLKLSNEALAKGIKDREGNERIAYRVLDPACFNQHGGPSIAQDLAAAGVHFRAADNTRVSRHGGSSGGPISGWAQVNSRLVGNADGHPMIFFFSTCRDTLRTLPVLMHDANNPEDLDSSMEDHCFAAGTLVEAESGAVPIEQLAGTFGRVLSRDGRYETYRSARLTRRSAELVRLTFADGRKILCTPDHRFLVGPDEWRYARNLQGWRVLCSQRSSAQRLKSSLGFATTSAASTSNAKASACIALCGSIIAGLFRSATTCTIAAMTGQTTVSPIWSAYRPASIWAGGTARKARDVVARASPRRGPLLLAGTVAMRGAAGTGSITTSTVPRFCTAGSPERASTAGQSSIAASRAAAFAATHARALGAALLASITRTAAAAFAPQHSGSTSTASSTHARWPAERLPENESAALCVSVEPAGRGDVYCLTVPSTGCFAVEGGLIVSNCADDIRYGCASRPWVQDLPAAKDRGRDDYRSVGPDEEDAEGSWRTA